MMRRLKLAAPVDRWDDAIPLGNGLLGGLLWGDGKKINLSLDRGDLWDERDNGIRRNPCWNNQALIDSFRKGDHEPCAELMKLYLQMPATKLPVGRIELELKSKLADAVYELDLHRAAGVLRDHSGAQAVSCFVDANSDLIYLKTDVPLHSIRIVPPDYQGTTGVQRSDSVSTLGYAPGLQGNSGNLQYFLQPCTENLNYGIFLYRSGENGYVIRVVSSDQLEELKKWTEDAVSVEFPAWNKAFRLHCLWWKKFWQRSGITLPDSRLQQFYELSRYFYGAASRRGLRWLSMKRMVCCSLPGNF